MYGELLECPNIQVQQRKVVLYSYLDLQVHAARGTLQVYAVRCSLLAARCLLHAAKYSLQDLENTAHSPHLALLNMFAYGNYKSFVQSPLGAMPEVLHPHM